LARSEGRADQPSGGPEGADSEPEPDLAVVRGSRGTYADRHPTSDEVALIVEVAVTSLAHDRAALRRYAWAGIPSVWIVNLIDRKIEAYSDPSGPSSSPGYLNRFEYQPGESLTLSIEGNSFGHVAVVDLLG
jgi:Uma2 family endonuclease